MRRTFFLGALALSLSGSALVPAWAESSRASTQSADFQAASPSTELATRELGGTATPEEPPVQMGPELPIAPLTLPPTKVIRAFQGQASWYGPGLYGNRTSNGEVLRPGTFTAAHRSLPFGTKVLVTNLANGKTAMVRINDRGPFHGNRLIDVAHGAASQLGLTASGVATVKLEVVQ